jgi:hypothetical protein
VQQSEKIREKVKKFCNCLVPNITYCVQGLSCPGLVMSMVFCVQGLSMYRMRANNCVRGGSRGVIKISTVSLRPRDPILQCH